MVDFPETRNAFASRDRQRLLACLHPAKVATADLAAKVDAILNWPAVPFRSGLFLPCYEECLKKALRMRHRSEPPPQFLRSPAALDFLADLNGFEEWSDEHLLNRLVLDTVVPRRKAAVVGTMRDDGIYILEWVAHYRSLGFEHFFIYTNDNADHSDRLLACLARSGIATIIDNEVSGKVPPEAKAFGHALNLLPALRDFEWALFIDSDEFLVPAPEYRHSIHAVLSALERAFPAGEVAGICYDWLWFISDFIYDRRPGLLCERFQHARPHRLTKCIVRLRQVLSMRRQHYPEMAPEFRFVDSAFRPLQESAMFARTVAEYGGGRLNHYWPKSFEEFSVKKARGAILGKEDNLYDRPFSTFFSWNGCSTPQNAFPTDPQMLKGIRGEIAWLRNLPGVADAADEIDRDFPELLHKVCASEALRRLYVANRAEPGPL
jgi:hypothetical protein